jgi:hypothetical protein
MARSEVGSHRRRGEHVADHDRPPGELLEDPLPEQRGQEDHEGLEHHEECDHLEIESIPADGGEPMVVMAFDDPSLTVLLYLSIDAERLYWTIGEYESDIQVADLNWQQHCHVT